jgi:hypothetical protein
VVLNHVAERSFAHLIGKVGALRGPNPGSWTGTRAPSRSRSILESVLLGFRPGHRKAPSR